VRLSDKRRNCKGASGKTSGRSIFPNAPLRATSSTTMRSMSGAILKALPTCIYRTRRQVAFARGRKDLRKFTECDLGNAIVSTVGTRRNFYVWEGLPPSEGAGETILFPI
jgi:hypothetical protein